MYKPDNIWKRRLPEYDPPEVVWDAIAHSLESGPGLRDTLQELPGYDPPEEVWWRISGALDKPRRFLPVWAQLVAAAAMVGAFLLGWYWSRQVPSERVTITYTEEVLREYPELQLSEADKDAFSIIQKFCSERAWLCSMPEFKMLQQELEDLDQAKTRLLKALGPYKEDPELLALLSRIERERSEVLKEMVAMM